MIQSKRLPHVHPPDQARVLIAHGSEFPGWSLRDAIEKAGHVVEAAGDAATLLERGCGELPDVVLLGDRLPDGDGLGVLEQLLALAPGLPVVVLASRASFALAVEAMRAGAFDYVRKPFEVDSILERIQNAIDHVRAGDAAGRAAADDRRGNPAGSSVRRAGPASDLSGSWGLLQGAAPAASAIVAESPAMRKVLSVADRVRSSPAGTVLLLGESGVGKGIVAEYLRRPGPASRRPFVNITCTALAETLLESELFGHEKGAFTDARSRKLGLLELADGGTLFLDEIGDLSPRMQGRLLQFLEDRTFRRVGGTDPIRVDLRVVAATNRELRALVEEGSFRRDLYYRLNVVPIEVPPLRRRVEDIEPLANTFLAGFCAAYGYRHEGFAPEAVEALRQPAWPGNARELRNVVERAVLLKESGRIGVEDLLLESESSTSSGGVRLPAEGLDLVELERDLVCQALARAQGNRTAAGRMLGLNRDQIRYRIEKFNLEDGLGEPERSPELERTDR